MRLGVVYEERKERTIGIVNELMYWSWCFVYWLYCCFFVYTLTKSPLSGLSKLQRDVKYSSCSPEDDNGIDWANKGEQWFSLYLHCWQEGQDCFLSDLISIVVAIFSVSWCFLWSSDLPARLLYSQDGTNVELGSWYDWAILLNQKDLIPSCSMYWLDIVLWYL